MEQQFVRFVIGEDIVRVRCPSVPRVDEYVAFNEKQSFCVTRVSHVVLEGADGEPELMTSVSLRPLE